MPPAAAPPHVRPARAPERSAHCRATTAHAVRERTPLASHARARSLPSRDSLSSWATTAPLTLPGGGAVGAWTTYPGLFAGGGVDVMTAALLRALPAPPPGARVLDACCGSGTIAAALRARPGG